MATGGSEVIMTGEAGLPHEPFPRIAQPPLHVIMKTVAPHLTLVHSIAGPCGRWLCACFQPHCLSLEMSVAFSLLSAKLLARGEDSLPCRGDPAVGIFEEQKEPVCWDNTDCALALEGGDR